MLFFFEVTDDFFLHYQRIRPENEKLMEMDPVILHFHHENDSDRIFTNSVITMIAAQLDELQDEF